MDYSEVESKIRELRRFFPSDKFKGYFEEMVSFCEFHRAIIAENEGTVVSFTGAERSFIYQSWKPLVREAIRLLAFDFIKKHNYDIEEREYCDLDLYEYGKESKEPYINALDFAHRKDKLWNDLYIDSEYWDSRVYPPEKLYDDENTKKYVAAKRVIKKNDLHHTTRTAVTETWKVYIYGEYVIPCCTEFLKAKEIELQTQIITK